MEFITLLQMLGRPWLMLPEEAMRYSSILNDMLMGGGVPSVDKRRKYQSFTTVYADAYPIFRVNKDAAVDQEGPVQVYRLDYPIAKSDYCGSPGTQSLQSLFLSADQDPTIQAHVMWIDSPGGQADGTEDLANVIKSLKKPVITYSDHMIASAAYWIASAASEIITSGSNNGWNNVIGSIGTMVMFYDDTEKNQKEGRKMVTVFADKSSDKWGDYFSMMKGDYTKLKEQLNGLNDTFLSAVQTNRAGKLKLDKEDVLTGKTYNAKDAIKYGLVDRTGDFKFAVRRAMLAAKNNQLITINTTMAFEKTLTVAKTESFAVVEGGFLLEEQHLNNIEQTLTDQATQIDTLTTGQSESAKQIADLTQKLGDAQSTIAQRDKEIAQLKSEAPNFRQSSKDEDTPPFNPPAENEEFLTEFDLKVRELKSKK